MRINSFCDRFMPGSRISRSGSTRVSEATLKVVEKHAAKANVIRVVNFEGHRVFHRNDNGDLQYMLVSFVFPFFLS